MRYFQQKVRNERLFVNMDQTAIYFDQKIRKTVHKKGEKTISIRAGTGGSKRVTLCVTAAFDGTKLPLFVIYKARPGRAVERSLPQI